MYTSTKTLTVALAAGVLAAPLILSGCSPDGTDNQGTDLTTDVPVTDVSDSTSTGATGASVNTDGLDPAYINAGSVQAWADDVAAGDGPGLTTKCWTLPADYVSGHYTAVTDRIATALSTTPVSAQDGYVWGSGSATEVRVPWAEGESEYACPHVDLDGNHSPDDSTVTWTARRFLLREQGRPVNVADTEQAYPLRCGYSQQPVDPTAVAAADPDDLTVVSHDWDHGRWYLTTTGARATMSVENGRVCVVGVDAA